MKNLISPEYKELLAWEHSNTPGRWGRTAEMYVDTIVRHSDGLTDWLDYGAGSGGLNIAIQKRHAEKHISITEYEPSRPNTVAPDPKPYVVCIDVLEHIEPGLIDNVLDDLQRVTQTQGYFTISCRLATKILKDGRNAHILVKPRDWWKQQIESRFNILSDEWDPLDQNYRLKVEFDDIPDWRTGTIWEKRET